MEDIHKMEKKIVISILSMVIICAGGGFLSGFQIAKKHYSQFPCPDMASIDQLTASGILPDSVRVMPDGKILIWHPHIFQVGDAVETIREGYLGYIQSEYQPGLYVVSFESGRTMMIKGEFLK